VFQRHSLGSTPTDLAPFAGVERRSSWTIRNKYLETPLAALTSFISLCFQPADLVVLCNAANSPFAWILRLRGVPVAINVDGIERKRKKWSAIGRLWYRLGERCSVWFGSRVIADAGVIADYYRSHYSITPAVISYGAEEVVVPPGAAHKEFGITAGGYILYVSRLEPENNALGVIEGYQRSGVTLPLVIVGDAPYADAYKHALRAAAERCTSGRVHFTGFRFGEQYRELRSNCALYIQATEVGGTHPALLEAMAHGNCIVANDVPEHREVLGEAGEFYPFNDFTELGVTLRRLCSEEGRRKTLGSLARARARELYSWNAVTDQYVQLITETLSRSAEVSP
jgi:glycosyltransferase involved in cell wall biosynthesis